MLVSREQTTPTPVPNEEGAFFTFRLITPNQLQNILDERQRKAMAKAASMGQGVVDIVREVAEARAKAAEEARTTEAKPAPQVESPAKPKPPTVEQVVASYDRTLLLLSGIAAWSGGCYEGVDVSLATVEDLDWKTSYWAAKKVLEHNKLLPGQDDLGN